MYFIVKIILSGLAFVLSLPLADRRVLGRLLGPLLKTGFPLMKNVLKALTRKVLIPLGLTAAASVKDAAIYKKMFGSGITTLIISNEEVDDFVKIVKSLD